MKLPDTQSIWNAILTAVGVALLACLGWQMAEIAKLKEYVAAETVTEFSEQEADQLRRDLTNAMTDIDMRISLTERDIQWVKILSSMRQVPIIPSPPDPSPPALPDDERVEPTDEPTNEPPTPPSAQPWEMPKMPSPQQQSPRYDVRRRQER